MRKLAIRLIIDLIILTLVGWTVHLIGYVINNVSEALGYWIEPYVVTAVSFVNGAFFFYLTSSRGYSYTWGDLVKEADRLGGVNKMIKGKEIIDAGGLFFHKDGGIIEHNSNLLGLERTPYQMAQVLRGLYREE